MLKITSNTEQKFVFFTVSINVTKNNFMKKKINITKNIYDLFKCL